MLQMAAQFGPFVLNALAQGVNGGDFADSVSMMFGPLVYKQIAAQGKESILKMLQAHPEIWVQLKPLEGKLDHFIDEFLEYGKEESEKTAGADTGPSPADSDPKESAA